MKLYCDGLDLSDAVSVVLKATSNKTTNPILEGIKLRAYENFLELSATDLELSIVKVIRADIRQEGEIVVPGAFFSNYIKKLTNEQIELFVNDTNQLKIGYSDSEGYVQCYKADEFPVIKKVSDEKYFALKQNDFKTLVNKSIFAVAVDDSRPILKGVLLEIVEQDIKAVALDGYRLALVKKSVVESSEDLSVIVPSRSLNEISKILEDNDEIVKFYVQKNLLMLEVNGVCITTRLIEGDFINYKEILPKTFTTECIINTAQFESTLERVSLLARLDRNNLVKFDMKENNILITSNSEIGNIKENLNASLIGSDLLIAFNARYFSDVLKVSGSEYIKIKLNSPYSPCIVVPSSLGEEEPQESVDEYIYLILPVRII